jgi:hypothetical protein
MIPVPAQDRLSIESYRMIVRLLETRNFTTTAAEFGVTQSAVTQKLQKFQDVWRAKLMERRGNEFVLTPEGQEFRTRFRTLVDQFSAVDLRHVRRNRVRVGVSTAFLSTGVMKNVMTGDENQLDVMFESDATIRSLILSNMIDVAVTLLESDRLDTVDVSKLAVVKTGPDNGVLLKLKDVEFLNALVSEHIGSDHKAVMEFPDSLSLLTSMRMGLGQGLIVTPAGRSSSVRPTTSRTSPTSASTRLTSTVTPARWPRPASRRFA